MKNKKGFTIIELMGTIVILALISAIVIPSVLSIIRRIKNDAYTDQVGYIIKAAEKWSVNNTDSFSETRNFYLSVDELIAGGYLEKDKLIDPRDNVTLMSGCITIEFKSEYNQYSYDYSDESCLGSPESPGSNQGTTLASCFTVSGGTITGYTCGDTIISIPGKINDVNVTGIGNAAFKNKGLVGLQLPEGLLQIGNEAFSGNNLTRVIFPESLSYIGTSAFTKNKLTIVAIPNNVAFIGVDAFVNNRITSLTLGNGISALNTNVFMDNQIRNLLIPNSVNSIAAGALSMNRIVNIEIPASVTTFDCSAFEINNMETIKFLGTNTNIANVSACTNSVERYSIASMIVPVGSVNYYDNLDGTLNGRLNSWPLTEG